MEKIIISKLILSINLRKCDPIHAMRIISNFYDKYKNKDENEKNKLIKEMEMQKKNIVNDIHSFEFQILIYLLSNRDKSKEPKENCNCIINYVLRNDAKLDEDLLRFNILVQKGEFK